MCDTISGYNNIQFNPSNSPVASPNSIGSYGINFDCLGPTGVIFIHWNVTGDITLSNGGTSIQTGSGTTDIPLTFGPGFTTGTLCVYLVTSFGLVTDTICMTINAPVGIAESNSSQLNFYVENQNEQLILDLPSSELKRSIEIYDSAGRLVSQLNVEPSSSLFTKKINLSSLSDGLYIINLVENDKRNTGRFMLSR